MALGGISMRSFTLLVRADPPLTLRAIYTSYLQMTWLLPLARIAYCGMMGGWSSPEIWRGYFPPALARLLVKINSFWLMTLHDVRPNNSFKPTPLRGAA